MPTRRISDLVTNAHMQQHRRARALMKCLATLIARGDSSELTSESLIKGRLMGGAHRAINIHVGLLVLR